MSMPAETPELVTTSPSSTKRSSRRTSMLGSVSARTSSEAWCVVAGRPASRLPWAQSRGRHGADHTAGRGRENRGPAASTTRQRDGRGPWARGTSTVGAPPPRRRSTKGNPVLDVLYAAVVIAVFAVLLLAVRGLDRL